LGDWLTGGSYCVQSCRQGRVDSTGASGKVVHSAPRNFESNIDCIASTSSSVGGCVTMDSCATGQGRRRCDCRSCDQQQPVALQHKEDQICRHSKQQQQYKQHVKAHKTSKVVLAHIAHAHDITVQRLVVVTSSKLTLSNVESSSLER
jgi:hypothetical protein